MSCRGEKPYKLAIKNHHANDIVIDELRADKSRVDCAVITIDSLIAYEIKSELDNLQRLEGQLLSYQKVFTVLNVATCEKHVAKIEKIIRHDIGIYCLDNNSKLFEVRHGVKNTDFIESVCVFDSLRRKEQAFILNYLDIKIDDSIANTEIFTVMRNEFRKIPPAIIYDVAVIALNKFRGYL